MEIVNMIRFLLGLTCLFFGLTIFMIEMIGVFRLKYVLNRMHAAAIGDTFGIGVSLLGLMILSGFNFTTLKISLIIVFFWLASPVSSHLISRLEVTTNEHLEDVCELPVEDRSFKKTEAVKKTEEDQIC